MVTQSLTLPAFINTAVSVPPQQPLQIKSVVAPDHVKGYIYVESYKQTHVKAAIEGIGNLRMGLWNQQMVPIKEMTDVLKVVKEVTNLKPKSWVRLKRGLYKDDIAQVLIDDRADGQTGEQKSVCKQTNPLRTLLLKHG